MCVRTSKEWKTSYYFTRFNIFINVLLGGFPRTGGSGEFHKIISNTPFHFLSHNSCLPFYRMKNGMDNKSCRMPVTRSPCLGAEEYFLHPSLHLLGTLQTALFQNEHLHVLSYRLIQGDLPKSSTCFPKLKLISFQKIIICNICR